MCLCALTQHVICVSLGLSSFCQPVCRFSMMEAGFSGYRLQQTEGNLTHFKQIPGISQHALNPQFAGLGSRGSSQVVRYLRECAGVRGRIPGDRPAQTKGALSLPVHSSLLTQLPENEASLPGGRVLPSFSLPLPPSHILLWIAYLIGRVWTQLSENS